MSEETVLTDAVVEDIARRIRAGERIITPFRDTSQDRNQYIPTRKERSETMATGDLPWAYQLGLGQGANATQVRLADYAAVQYQAILDRQAQQTHPMNPSNRREESMLNRLKNLAKGDDSASDVELLVELAAYGRSLRAEFETQKIPVPKWLTDNLRILGSKIQAAYRAQQEEKLRRLDREIEDLKSKEEKKAAKEKEREELLATLGLDAEVKER